MISNEQRPSLSTRVKLLEGRQQELQALLQQVLPDMDLSGDFDPDEMSNLLDTREREELGFYFKMCRRCTEHLKMELEYENIMLYDQSVPSVPAYLRGRFAGKSSQATRMSRISRTRQRRSSSTRCRGPDRRFRGKNKSFPPHIQYPTSRSPTTTL